LSAAVVNALLLSTLLSDSQAGGGGDGGKRRHDHDHLELSRDAAAAGVPGLRAANNKILGVAPSPPSSPSLPLEVGPLKYS